MGKFLFPAICLFVSIGNGFLIRQNSRTSVSIRTTDPDDREFFPQYGSSVYHREGDDDDDEGNGTDGGGADGGGGTDGEETVRNWKPARSKVASRSTNFEVIANNSFNFRNVAGYFGVKTELMQCADMLVNRSKYAMYNVRVPKGILLEGPPGNGKTILARGFSGETNTSFIAASGSQFQDRYVGVGSSRVRELFALAEKFAPCIVFIDEIDALGRNRGGGVDGAEAERDNTLNQLLTAMDGFTQSDGIFVIGATNRADLLDPALIRPGRIDKRLYIGNPDADTRARIIQLHLQGKPHQPNVNGERLLAITNGMSAAEIENLLNEAMLFCIREDRQRITMHDIERIYARTIGGWQENANALSPDMLWRIAVHEIGHALAGHMTPGHPPVQSVNLNLFSPRSPGYTIFEREEVDTNIFTKERLFASLVVLLSGRVAEDLILNHSVTTGAVKDFDEARQLAERMVVHYGMGKENIYSYSSDRAKSIIDKQVMTLIQDAQTQSLTLLEMHQDLIVDLARLLLSKRTLKRANLVHQVSVVV